MITLTKNKLVNTNHKLNRLVDYVHLDYLGDDLWNKLLFEFEFKDTTLHPINRMTLIIINDYLNQN